MVKDAAIEGEDKLRHFIENKPYSATAIALGIGLAIGYMDFDVSQHIRSGAILP